MARFYNQSPRRPMSYQAYLAGPLEDVIGAETAAAQPLDGAGRAILIGVVTGALTLLVNRLLEKLIK